MISHNKNKYDKKSINCYLIDYSNFLFEYFMISKFMVQKLYKSIFIINFKKRLNCKTQIVQLKNDARFCYT